MTAEQRKEWFASYLDTLLQRDVHELANLGRLSGLPDLLATLAAKSGQLLNYADLARMPEVPQTTLKRHAALMEAAFLSRRLKAWFGNLEKRLAKAPKALITDTGVLTRPP